jgi:hypothetical protein
MPRRPRSCRRCGSSRPWRPRFRASGLGAACRPRSAELALVATRSRRRHAAPRGVARSVGRRVGSPEG